MKSRTVPKLQVVVLLLSLNGPLFFAPPAAFGDGEPSGTSQSRNLIYTPTTRQYNDRLPPVLPGEEVVTETGQKMRVWSSAGPVPVNQQPTPQPLPGGRAVQDAQSAGGVGVIVDSRR